MALNSLRATELKQWKRVRLKEKKDQNFVNTQDFKLLIFIFSFKPNKLSVEVYLT